jgi:hypothetical protein
MGHSDRQPPAGRVEIFHARSELAQRLPKGPSLMKTLKWYGYRATMFLGTIAAGFAIIDSCKRW